MSEGNIVEFKSAEAGIIVKGVVKAAYSTQDGVKAAAAFKKYGGTVELNTKGVATISAKNGARASYNVPEKELEGIGKTIGHPLQDGGEEYFASDGANF